MRQLEHHPCLVNLYEVYMSSDGEHLCLILSFCDSGSLGKVHSRHFPASMRLVHLSRSCQAIQTTRKLRKQFRESQLLHWAIQISFALHHLHQHQFIHRDLKPDNILLSENHSLVRLADFGLAIQVDDSAGASLRSEVSKFPTRDVCGTFAASHRAPPGPIFLRGTSFCSMTIRYETEHDRPFSRSGWNSTLYQPGDM